MYGIKRHVGELLKHATHCNNLILLVGCFNKKVEEMKLYCDIGVSVPTVTFLCRVGHA